MQVGNDLESGGGWMPCGTIAPHKKGMSAVNNCTNEYLYSLYDAVLEICSRTYSSGVRPTEPRNARIANYVPHLQQMRSNNFTMSVTNFQVNHLNDSPTV